MAVLAVIFLSSACSDEFLNRPSEDSYTMDNFYSSNEQIDASVTPFYGKIWMPFATKWYVGLGELTSGNCQAGADAAELVTFSLTSNSPALSDPWATCFSVIVQSNNLINNLEKNVGSDVSHVTVKTAIAEAHFMRGLAYFYLVRLFGNVPIIENNFDYMQKPLINTNPVADVYTFIKRDFQYAVDNLPSKIRGGNKSENIRLSSGSAKSFLAKVHLYRKEYAEAVRLSNEVITSGEFKLLGGAELPSKSFGDLFLVSNNNNEESIFSWQFITMGWGFSNYNAIQYGPSSLTEGTWGASYVPTFDIQSQYKPEDKRRKDSFMKVGDVYPNLVSDQGSSYTFSSKIASGTATGSYVKKFVLGKHTDETGPQDAFGTSGCMYIMRYADLLLINSEAIMGENSSTTDETALRSYNQVLNRAGLPSVTTITHADLIQQRRLEFAFEGEYWYDLCRLPRAEAIELIKKQNRGQWGGSLYVTPVESDFIFPIPASEVITNPKLLDPPVPYDFKGLN